MYIAIPYYSSSELIDIRSNSLFPVVTYVNDRNMSVNEVENIVKRYSQNGYAYGIHIDQRDNLYKKENASIFTIFLPNKGDCQIKKLKIYLSRETISFEAVCPKMIPVNHDSLIKFMDKQDYFIQTYWHSVVERFTVNHHTGIGIVQNYLDRPLIALANYIYSFSEIVANEELIKSIVGINQFQSPEFNTEYALYNIGIDDKSTNLDTVLNEIYSKSIKCNEVPFYANIVESEDIVFGSYGWPYEEEQNSLQQRNIYFLKYFSDWESCLELLFYNMALLSAKGKNILFGYTTASIINLVLKYSALNYKDNFPMSFQSWIDLRLYENSITSQYVVDIDERRWTLVYQPSNNFSTPSLRLARLVRLISKTLVKEFSDKEFKKYSTLHLWNKLLAVLRNNIKDIPLSSVLNTVTYLNEHQDVIQESTSHRLLWLAQRAGMFSAYGNIIEANSNIKAFKPLDVMADFNIKAKNLIHEIISVARENRIGFNDIQNVTNFYLADKIDFREAEEIERKLKKLFAENVFLEIENDGNISKDSVKNLANIVDNLFNYFIGFDYNSFKSEYINLSDELRTKITNQQEKIIRCLIAINILLGLYRLHNADKVLTFFGTIKSSFLINGINFESFEDYLESHKTDFEKTEVINFINNFLKSI